MIYEGNVFQTKLLCINCEYTLRRGVSKYLLVPFMFLLMILSLAGLPVLPVVQPSLSSPAGLMTGEGQEDMLEYPPGSRERSGIRARSEYSDGLAGGNGGSLSVN